MKSSAINAGAGNKKPGTVAPRPIAQSLPIALLRAREAVMAHFRPLLSARGYTEQQWRVLRILDESGALEPTELAHRAALLQPSLTRILKTLEQRGDILRTGNSGDARRSSLSISTRASAFIAAEQASTEAAYHAIIDKFGAENSQLLLELLAELAAIEPPRTP